jgi:hypothetical protein
MKAAGRKPGFACLPLCLLLSALGLRCSSAPLTEPEIHISQISNLAEAAAHVSGNISVQYQVDIANHGNVTITIKRIDVISLGEGAYTLRPSSFPFDAALSPGQATAVQFWAPAVIADPTIIGANGPVSLRVTTQYETPSGRAQSVVVQQVHALSSL